MCQNTRERDLVWDRDLASTGNEENYKCMDERVSGYVVAPYYYIVSPNRISEYNKHNIATHRSKRLKDGAGRPDANEAVWILIGQQQERWMALMSTRVDVIETKDYTAWSDRIPWANIIYFPRRTHKICGFYIILCRYIHLLLFILFLLQKVDQHPYRIYESHLL